VDGEGIGGIMPMPQGAKTTPPHWGAYVTVDNVDDTAKRAKELGAKILVSPVDISDIGRFSIFQDPQGAVLSIITYVKK
jgi:predicted enzyme related to lactoylglutathione lyase